MRRPNLNKIIITHRPPWNAAPTSRRTFLEALLHIVRQLPPSLGLRVGGDPGHVLLIVVPYILEVRDKQLKRFVVMDRVVGDIMSCEGIQNTGPSVGVNINVFSLVFGLELEVGFRRSRVLKDTINDSP